MSRKCLGCPTVLTTGWAKYCGNACYSRVRYNQKKGLPDDHRGWTPSQTCAQCGSVIENRGPQSKYCSRRCHWDASHRKQTRRARQAKRLEKQMLPGDLAPCSNPQCTNAAIFHRRKPWCSKRCQDYVRGNKHWLGEGPSTRVYFRPCQDCQTLVTMTNGGGTPKVCESCRVIRNRGINGRKAHARRASGPPALSVDQLAARDGCRCHICHRKIDMALTGLAKWGPTIEHILPVSKGGTNEPENLALAHRHCNTARGNRGHSQLTMVA